MVQGNIPKLQTWPPDGATCPLQAKDSATIWCLIWSSIGSNFGHQAELPALISNCAIRRSRLPLLFRPRQSVKDKLSSILYYMITPQLSHPINNLPPPPHYICVFRRSEWKWVKIPQRKRSQNVAVNKIGWLPRNFFRCASISWIGYEGRSTIFHEIFKTTDYEILRFWLIRMTTLQPYNLTTLQPYNLTTLQPHNLTT